TLAHQASHAMDMPWSSLVIEVGRGGSSGTAIVFHRLGHPAADVLDAGLVGWMGAEPLGLSAALVRGAHAFPETDRLVRVVAGARHQHEADVVGFGLLGARHREQDADAGAR